MREAGSAGGGCTFCWEGRKVEGEWGGRKGDGDDGARLLSPSEDIIRDGVWCCCVCFWTSWYFDFLYGVSLEYCNDGALVLPVS